MLLPPSNYSYDKISPINTINNVEEQEKNIQVVSQLDFTAKLLLAAQYKAKG